MEGERVEPRSKFEGCGLEMEVISRRERLKASVEVDASEKLMAEKVSG